MLETTFQNKVNFSQQVGLIRSYSLTTFQISVLAALNSTHYFIMKIPNKRELQQTLSNHLSDIEFKDFMKLYKDYTKEPF